MGPLIVVDIQPAYQKAFTHHLAQAVLDEMRSVPEGEPIIVVSVNEELSGDAEWNIREFWEGQDMEPELFDRITFLEKPYAFLRGWMDNGVPEDEIVAVLKEMRRRRKTDSRDLPEEDIEEISSRGAELSDPLILPEELEDERAYRGPAWRICGGGYNECLREVELWLASRDIEFERLEHLTY
jgi:hypothetical protein